MAIQCGSLAWYALVTPPKHEKLAAQFLAERGIEAFAPFVMTRKKLYDRVQHKLAPLFPRYIFARFSRNQAMDVETTAGVTTIVRFGSQMAEVDTEQVESLMAAIASGAIVEPVEYSPSLGDRVVIETGCFAGKYGRVTRIKGEDRVVLSVDALQRTVLVELPVAAVSVAA
jgi:transcriptional antiterminator RfaH